MNNLLTPAELSRQQVDRLRAQRQTWLQQQANAQQAAKTAAQQQLALQVC